MSGAASEQLALLASFAEEIEPLLAMLAGAIDRLVEHPDDATALTIGRAQVQTLEGEVNAMTGHTSFDSSSQFERIVNRIRSNEAGFGRRLKGRNGTRRSASRMRA